MKCTIFAALVLIASTATAGTTPPIPPCLRPIADSHGPAVPNLVRLAGSEAMSHIEERSAKHAGPFGKAVEALKKRGFHPTTHAWVVSYTGQASSPVDTKNGIQLAQYSWSDSGGEID